MNRREFIKGGATVAGAAALTSCAPGFIRKKAGKSDSNGTRNGSTDGEMTYRTDARFGDKVSVLGYGCMRWPNIEGTKGDENLDQDMINTLVDKAIEKGVTYFDTAPVYHSGLSERVTGIALSRHKREEYLIATKLSNFSPASQSREASIKMYENSFKELQVDYIDYYLLHALGSNYESFENRYIKNGMLDFLVEEREKGRIRHLGYSFHGDKKSFDYYLSMHEKYHWDFVQIQMNYIDWKYAVQNNKRNTNADYMYEELTKRGIPVVIMEPLLGGRLARVPQPIVDRMMEYDPGRSVASWAFRFCGTYPGVMSVLSGMTYMEHLEDNLHSFSPLEPLSEKDLAFLDHTAQLMMEYPTIPCNDCKYCIPCPYGIDIPGIFQHYNKCVNEGSIAPDTMDPNFRKARQKYLSSYGKAIPDMRQADKCIGCGQCMPLCPQSIKIPTELRKIDRYVENLRKSMK